MKKTMKKSWWKICWKNVDEEGVEKMLMKKTLKKMLMKKTMTLQKTQKVGSFFPLRLIGFLPRNPETRQQIINQCQATIWLLKKSQNWNPIQQLCFPTPPPHSAQLKFSNKKPACIFLSDPGVPGVRSMGLVVSHWVSELPFWNVTDVNFATIASGAIW